MLTEVDLSHTKVTGIESFAFHVCYGLQIVRFPSTLETIEHWAFEECNFGEVDLSHTRVIKIGEYAFNGCEEIKTIKFPSTLKGIEKKHSKIASAK